MLSISMLLSWLWLPLHAAAAGMAEDTRAFMPQEIPPAARAARSLLTTVNPYGVADDTLALASGAPAAAPVPGPSVRELNFRTRQTLRRNERVEQARPVVADHSEELEDEDGHPVAVAVAGATHDGGALSRINLNVDGTDESVRAGDVRRDRIGKPVSPGASKSIAARVGDGPGVRPSQLDEVEFDADEGNMTSSTAQATVGTGFVGSSNHAYNPPLPGRRRGVPPALADEGQVFSPLGEGGGLRAEQAAGTSSDADDVDDGDIWRAGVSEWLRQLNCSSAAPAPATKAFGGRRRSSKRKTASAPPVFAPPLSTEEEQPPSSGVVVEPGVNVGGADTKSGIIFAAGARQDVAEKVDGEAVFRCHSGSPRNGTACHSGSLLVRKSLSCGDAGEMEMMSDAHPLQQEAEQVQGHEEQRAQPRPALALPATDDGRNDATAAERHSAQDHFHFGEQETLVLDTDERAQNRRIRSFVQRGRDSASWSRNTNYTSHEEAGCDPYNPAQDPYDCRTLPVPKEHEEQEAAVGRGAGETTEDITHHHARSFGDSVGVEWHQSPFVYSAAAARATPTSLRSPMSSSGSASSSWPSPAAGLGRSRTRSGSGQEVFQLQDAALTRSSPKYAPLRQVSTASEDVAEGELAEQLCSGAAAAPGAPIPSPLRPREMVSL